MDSPWGVGARKDSRTSGGLWGLGVFFGAFEGLVVCGFDADDLAVYQCDQLFVGGVDTGDGGDSAACSLVYEGNGDDHGEDARDGGDGVSGVGEVSRRHGVVGDECVGGVGDVKYDAQAGVVDVFDGDGGGAGRLLAGHTHQRDDGEDGETGFHSRLPFRGLRYAINPTAGMIVSR